MKRQATVEPQSSRVKQLFNGDYVITSYVSTAILERIASRVDEPKIPIYKTEDGSELENPTDPAYLREMNAYELKKNMWTIRALAMLGLQLSDEEGVPIDPPDNGWENKLRRVGIDWEQEMLAMMNRKEFANDADREQARKDAYLVFVAVTGHPQDQEIIGALSGAPQSAQEEAEDMFQREA